MFRLNQIKEKLLITTSAVFLSSISLHTYAATATYDPASGAVDLPVVEVLNGALSSFYNAKLQLSGSDLQLTAANPISAVRGQRIVFDSDTQAVHIPSVTVGADDYYVKLKFVPGSNPMRFTIDQLVNNKFQGCPSFSVPGVVAGSCVLSGEITHDITLTKNVLWVLSGGVYIGGDNKDSATLTINPGTKIIGQAGADYLWIRRGSKIMSEGTPDNPVVMSGPNQVQAGEWGGLVLAGNAPINGCNVGVTLCEAPYEAVTSELYGGNNPTESSGLIKYTQILFAGFAVRPDEELNGLTLAGVGSNTVLQFIHVHRGLDDGIEMFGGNAQFKHVVLTKNGDDNIDWGGSWTGRAQFALIIQAADDGDRGIEADNNEKNNDSLPRANPILSNVTAIGSGIGTQAVMLRRGTGGHIWNSAFTGWNTCLIIDGGPTFAISGPPGSLSGWLTMNNTYLNCNTNFQDGKDATFKVSDWFLSQSGNTAGDFHLSGYLPATGSPLVLGGTTVLGNSLGHPTNAPDTWFDAVNYAGAFKDEHDDWTAEWTFPFK
ncbi:MAG: hypothetical protein KGN35_02885 [Betaproteobacteria bacterium]|nr:hypothetical protein [Betaproteobacteria bacterium]